MLTSGQFIPIYTISQYLEINYIDIFSRNVLLNRTLVCYNAPWSSCGERTKISSKFRRTVKFFSPYKSRNTHTFVLDLETDKDSRLCADFSELKDPRGNPKEKSFSRHCFDLAREGLLQRPKRILPICFREQLVRTNSSLHIGMLIFTTPPWILGVNEWMLYWVEVLGMFVAPLNLYTRAIYHADETREALRAGSKKRKRKNIMIGCTGCIFNKKFRIGVLQTANTIIFRQQTDLIFKVYKSHL